MPRAYPVAHRSSSSTIHADPPPPYSINPTETSPLLAPATWFHATPVLPIMMTARTQASAIGKPWSLWFRMRVFIGAIIFAMFIAQNLGLLRCPLNDVPAAEKARLRALWRTESDEHARDVDTWARERTEYEAERRAHEAERRAHEAEREQWAVEREKEELHRLEVLRRSQGVYWTEPSGDAHCHAYGTRTYVAYLRDIPGDLNWREVCEYMPPVVIHGRALAKPDKCERNGRGEVFGVWYVDFDEPNCRPHWDHIESKGCSAGQKGIERFEGRLNGVARGDDWKAMCANAPATIRNIVFDRPSSCEDRVRATFALLISLLQLMQIFSQGLFGGMVGIWDYPSSWWC
ncbi:hypothetical protein BN946_scf184982.g23 [Trametes cinnabarina]|uniref:Uncharacterized protein n=1 Tax=Pycnoporus cinnabarinus TaxID=5643 RepID=A0A060SWE6_PYCCI|nr:hypothetical protein BN946_scf184982.g23 [Trametes cinnabarina]